MADGASRPAEVTSALSASARDECLGLAQVIDRVGDKWTVMVVGHLSQHSHLRFNALMRAVPGVSHRMLTLTLRGLEREGLVSRTAYATIPPRVDYALTPLGRSLTEPLAFLAAWASRHRPEIEAARHAYDHRAVAVDEVAQTGS